MSTGDDDGRTAVSPDDAFAALGNEIRFQILRILGETDDPLSFSDLHERVEIRDSGRFNYHLDQLVGHFVRKREDGYDLRPPGRRVLEAVLSGAVTDAPRIDRTRVDQSCFYCGAPVEVKYRLGQVGVYCTECRGQYEGSSRIEDPTIPSEEERIGYLLLPPAGVQGRTPPEVLDAAYTWYYNQVVTMASGVCPRCSATVESSVRICEGHEPTDGICDRCGNRHAVRVHYRCSNCILDDEMGFSNHLLDEPALHALMVDHGIDVVSPSRDDVYAGNGEYDIQVRSTDPFEARVTYTVDDDELVLIVDDELTVTSATRNP